MSNIVDKIEQLREAAPAHSVARTRLSSAYGHRRNPPSLAGSWTSASKGRASPAERKTSLSALEKPFATPFVLAAERTNKYKVDQRLKQTQDNKCMIPFLRMIDAEYTSVVRNRGGYHSHQPSQTHYLEANKRRVRAAKKQERGWEQYVIPISGYNERVHKSQKITFDKI